MPQENSDKKLSFIANKHDVQLKTLAARVQEIETIIQTTAPEFAPPDAHIYGLISEKDAATIMGISVGALRKKRLRGRIPANLYLQASKRCKVQYHRHLVYKYINGELKTEGAK